MPTSTSDRPSLESIFGTTRIQKRPSLDDIFSSTSRTPVDTTPFFPTKGDIPGIGAAALHGATLGLTDIGRRPISNIMSGIPGEMVERGAGLLKQPRQLWSNVIMGGGIPSIAQVAMGQRLETPESKVGFPTFPQPQSVVGKLAGMGVETATGALTGARLGKVLEVSAPTLTAPEQVLSLTKQAQKATSELLRPPTQRSGLIEGASDYLKRGQEHPAVVQMTNIIKKSNSYDDLIANTNQAIKTYGNAKQAILTSDNFDVNPEFPKEVVENLPKDLKERLDIPVGTIKRTEAQSFKERLDDELGKFYSGARSGTLSEKQKDLFQPLADYRASLAEKVNGGSEELKNLDSTYGGLKQGRELLADRAAEARSQPSSSWLPNIINHLRIIVSGKPHLFLSEGAGGILGKLAGTSLEGQTRKIESLMNQIRFLSPKSPLKTLSGEGYPMLEAPEGTKLLSGSIPKQLGVSPEFGQGFERLSPEESLARDIQYNPKIETPFYGERMEPPLRNAAGEIVVNPAISALQVAMKRRGLR